MNSLLGLIPLHPTPHARDSQGEDTKQKIRAKQHCLLIDSLRPPTIPLFLWLLPQLWRNKSLLQKIKDIYFAMLGSIHEQDFGLPGRIIWSVDVNYFILFPLFSLFLLLFYFFVFPWKRTAVYKGTKCIQTWGVPHMFIEACSVWASSGCEISLLRHCVEGRKQVDSQHSPSRKP